MWSKATAAWNPSSALMVGLCWCVVLSVGCRIYFWGRCCCCIMSTCWHWEAQGGGGSASFMICKAIPMKKHYTQDPSEVYMVEGLWALLYLNLFFPVSSVTLVESFLKAFLVLAPLPILRILVGFQLIVYRVSTCLLYVLRFVFLRNSCLKLSIY